MVEVTGPPTPSPLPSHPADSEQDREQSRIAVGPEGAVDSQAITRDSITQESFAASSPGADAAAGSSPGGAVFQSHGMEPSAATEDASRLDAATFAQSARSKRTRQIGLITTLSIAGAIASLVAFGFFVRWWQSAPDQPVVAKLPAEAIAATATPPTQAPTEIEADPLAQTDATSPDATSPDATSPDAELSDAELSDQGPTKTTGTDQPDSMAASAAPTAASEPNPAATNPAEPTPTEPTTEQIAAAMINTPVLDPADTEPASPATEMPEEMRRWTQVLRFDDPVEQPDLPTPPTLEQVELEMPAEAGNGLLEAAPTIDIDRWMQQKMAFEKRPAPLLRWVQVLSQITSVPLSVDLVSLDAAGLDPLLEVTPPGGWLSAEEALAAIATQANCEVRRTEAMLVIEASADRVAAGLAPGLTFQDLASGPAGNPADQQLLDQLQRLTVATAITRDDTNQLRIEGSTTSRWLTALTAEAIRLARGLPPRLPPQRTARWLVKDANQEWPLLEAGRAIDPIDQPLTVIDLLSRIGRRNDAYPIINWADALPQGMTPTSQSMPWLKDVTAAEAITEILDPFQLQARQLGDRLWWVGTAASYDRANVIAIAKIDPDQAGAILQRLAAAVGVASLDELSAFADTRSPYLIIRAPRFIVRQLPKIITPPAE